MNRTLIQARMCQHLNLQLMDVLYDHQILALLPSIFDQLDRLKHEAALYRDVALAGHFYRHYSHIDDPSMAKQYRNDLDDALTALRTVTGFPVPFNKKELS